MHINTTQQLAALDKLKVLRKQDPRSANNILVSTCWALPPGLGVWRPAAPRPGSHDAAGVRSNGSVVPWLPQRSSPSQW